MQPDFNRNTPPPFTPEKPQARIPYSFWIFMANVSSIILSFGMGSLAASLGWHSKYSPAITAPLLISLLLLSSGIYAGIVYRTEDKRRASLNKAGLWGCGILGAIVLIAILGFILNKIM